MTPIVQIRLLFWSGVCHGVSQPSTQRNAAVTNTQSQDHIPDLMWMHILQHAIELLKLQSMPSFFLHSLQSLNTE